MHKAKLKHSPYDGGILSTVVLWIHCKIMENTDLEIRRWAVKAQLE